MREDIIRFGVTDGAGKRGATWKIWTPRSKSDIYLVCRELKGAIKTSLHSSGSWHSGYTKESLEKYFDDHVTLEKQKYIDMWPRPKELVEGITLAFRIVTPDSAVNSEIESSLSGINWIANASPGKSIQIDIFITKDIDDANSWPGKNSMKTNLVGHYRLRSGEMVWVVSWEIPTPKIPSLKISDIKYVKGASTEDLNGGNLKAVLFYDENDGTRTLMDCKIQITAPDIG